MLSRSRSNVLALPHPPQMRVLTPRFGRTLLIHQHLPIKLSEEARTLGYKSSTLLYQDCRQLWTLLSYMARLVMHVILDITKLPIFIGLASCSKTIYLTCIYLLLDITQTL